MTCRDIVNSTGRVDLTLLLKGLGGSHFCFGCRQSRVHGFEASLALAIF